MSDFSFGGAPIRRCTLSHPVSGAASADLEIGTSDPLTGQQVLSLPGLDLTLTVVPGYGGVSYDRQILRAVGGQGGLSLRLPGQHFRQGSVQTVTDWLLQQAGELASAQSDPAVLAQQLDHWQHVAGTAAQGLTTLTDHLGTSWWTDTDGTVRIGTPLWAPSVADFDLLEESLAARRWTVVSTDSAVLPGTLFDPGEGAAAGQQQVVCVVHDITGDRWRSMVRW